MDRMKAITPAQQLNRFLAKYTPEIVKLATAILRKMRRRLPGAIELVYDNYNALVIGFGPTERPSEAVFSVAVMPQWVTLCFLKGAKLPDPQRILRGGGNVVRSVRLFAPSEFDKLAIQDLMVEALARCDKPFEARRKLIIRSLSPAQRPRRPASARSKGVKIRR
jgi:hypothetical protein